MKRDTKVVWNADNGTELLVFKGGDNYYIPLSTISTAILRELKAAIEDALSDDLARAIKDAQGKDK